MKLGKSFRTQQRRGFTLSETLITVLVTTMFMTGMIMSHVFGLRLIEFVKPKLAASDMARKTIGLLVDEVRSADHIRLGQRSGTNFVEVAGSTAQQANEIKICLTNAETLYAIYYLDTTNNTLNRITNNAASPQVVARGVNNLPSKKVFTFEDHTGAILTDPVGNPVLGVVLQCYQTNGLSKIGTNLYRDFYQLQTRITRRRLSQ